jgi:hypothetical protein
MAKARSKKRVIDDEDEDVIVETPAPEPEVRPAAVRRAEADMVLDLEGLGGVVASALVLSGLRAYLSVVNKGVNVVAANKSHTAFVPVRVEAPVGGLDVRRDEAKPLVDGQGVLAFLLGDWEDRVCYYIPVSEYLEMAEDRGESGLRLEIAEHADWLKKYQGHAGVRRAFARLLG